MIRTSLKTLFLATALAAPLLQAPWAVAQGVGQGVAALTPAMTGYRQAVAEAAARDEALSAFYRDRGYAGIWTGAAAEDAARRDAFLAALADAPAHGLPAGRFDPAPVIALLSAADTQAARGAAEVEMSRLFLDYARAVQTGLLVPERVDAQIKRVVPLRDRLATLTGFAGAVPQQFLRALPPDSPEYARLMREKLRLEQRLAAGGWGPTVPTGRIEAGAEGEAVIALRNRLIALGFLDRSVTRVYDATLQEAVRRFQMAHGLAPDAVVGDGTLAELNTPVEARLQSVMVAMERERWLNMPRGERHIWVNLTDFSAAIIDDGITTFTTPSVIGAVQSDKQSPEFSDEMDHMVINPTWFVPRSIIIREYLPQLQRNPNAVGNLVLTDRNGRPVARQGIDFRQFDARSFPFAMREPPSQGNALGLVKFMFPNPYNIYLHDTPSKSLFSREVRAFSSGCIRLNDPFDFAYALLARQTDDPVAFFQERLRSGRETRVNLEAPVPVHLVYRTAFTHATGELQFRRDIYGRDGRIWQALAREGVEIGGVQG